MGELAFPPGFQMQEVQAILFDIDGTLLNTFEFIYQSFEHALELAGAPRLSRPEIARYMGGPLEECYRMMAPGKDSIAMTEAHRVYQENNLGLVKLFPDTITVLEYLKRAGKKLGAITSRSRRTSLQSMVNTGIADFFQVILSAEDVTKLKPDPEPVLQALEILNVTPEHAVMTGDTYADILAGKNAGARTIGVLYGFGGEALLDTHPDIAIRELKELLKIIS